jgi:hypothetical protein
MANGVVASRPRRARNNHPVLEHPIGPLAVPPFLLHLKCTSSQQDSFKRSQRTCDYFVCDRCEVMSIAYTYPLPAILACPTITNQARISMPAN